MAIACLLGFTPGPGDAHEAKLHGFDMVAFDPPADAPGFDLPDVRDRQIGLPAFRGRFVLLNFWATWCAPCVREMPSLQRLEDTLGTKGISVVAISLDKPGREAKVKDFASDLDIRFKVLLDSQGVAQKLYGARELPSTFLIDPAGKIVAAAKGERDWASDEAISYFSEIMKGR